MSIQTTEFSKVIFEQIEEKLAEFVGPVAEVLCEEAFEIWEMRWADARAKIRYRHIQVYVEMLGEQLEDDFERQEFYSSVRELDSLKYFR